MEKILTPGIKLELNQITADKKKAAETYLSQVYDLDADRNRVAIAMPYKDGHMVVLSLGIRLNAYFYCKAKMYHSTVKVVDRYKSNNLIVLVIELQSELKKVQRRQFFRYDMIVPLRYMLLEEEFAAIYEKTGELPEEIVKEHVKNGQTINISGGGMKFVGSDKFQKDDIVYIELDYTLGGANQCLKVTARVVDSVNPQGRKDIFHSRVSFDNIKNDDREALVRFIFEEERKRMQLERRS